MPTRSFLCSATKKLLHGHVVAKHAKEVATPGKCFAELVGYDPNAPEPVAAAPVVKKKAAPKKVDDSLADMLSSGLAKGKKK